MKAVGRGSCRLAGLLLGILLPCLAAWDASPAVAKEQTVKLKHRVDDGKDRLFVPFERHFILAKDGADLPVGKSGRLACSVVDRDRIEVDVKGEGRFTKPVARGEVLELMIRHPTDGLQPHAIRMVNDLYGRPCLEPACARVGRLKGTPILVADADLNGRYDDYGRDLMVVGKLPYAYPLSRMVVVGRRLFHIAVARDGASLKATALDVALVKLDYVSELRGLKKPKMVVFRRAGDSTLDHVVAFRSPALVPAGEWALAYAAFSDDLWALGGDGLKPVPVGEEPVAWAWGAPFTLSGEAAVTDRGTERSVDPAGVLKAPRLIERTVSGKHIVCYFPPVVVGRAGLRYVGNWQHEGDGGVSLADKKISHFDVHISQDGKPLNSDMPRWAPYDLSGLVQKKPPFWTSFDWPVGFLRGTFSVAFSCKSPLFGGVIRSPPVEVDVN